MSADEGRRRAALHEAGHVVVARAAGYTVHKAEVYEGGGGGCWSVLPQRSSLEGIKAEIAYALAGRLAVALEADEHLSRFSWRELLDKELPTGKEGTPVEGFGVAGYRNALEAIYGGTASAERWLDVQLPKIVDETIRVLTVRWKEVTQIAGRLLDEGTIDFLEDELRELDGFESAAAKPVTAKPKLTPRRRATATGRNSRIPEAFLGILANPTSTPATRSSLSSWLERAGYELGELPDVPSVTRPAFAHSGLHREYR